MPITTNNPATVAARPAASLPYVWVDESHIIATPRNQGPVNASYTYTRFNVVDGVYVFEDHSTSVRMDDIYTLAQDPARSKLAALITAYYDAIQEDISIREAQN